MKAFNQLILLSILFCSSCTATKNNVGLQYADVMRTETELLKGENNCTIKLFQGIFVENKVYISWTAVSDCDNLCFIIDKSYDNKEYKPVFIKKGMISPKSTALLYCAIDTVVDRSQNKQIFYRLRVIKQSEFSEKFNVNKVKTKKADYPTISVNSKSNSGNYNLFHKETMPGKETHLSTQNLKRNNK